MRTLVTALLLIAAQEPMSVPLPGMWGTRASYLWPGPTAIADYPRGGRAIDVPSPDRSMILSVRDSTLMVRRTGATHDPVGTSIPIEDLAEVLWAPDSCAFALTWSDGGWVGSWHVVVYRVSSGSLVKLDIAKQAFGEVSKRTIKRDRPCDIEEPNMAAVAWLGGSYRLLVLAEAPPHSSCCDAGQLRGYALEGTTGKILDRYSEADVLRLYGGQLGARFQAAQPAR